MGLSRDQDRVKPLWRRLVADIQIFSLDDSPTTRSRFNDTGSPLCGMYHFDGHKPGFFCIPASHTINCGHYGQGIGYQHLEGKGKRLKARVRLLKREDTQRCPSSLLSLS